MSNRFYFYDLHCHTTASIDTPGKLKGAVKMAKKRGVDGIAITDHDEVYKGPVNIDGIDIISGTEITMENGDHLLGYFVEEKVEKELSLEKAVTSVHSQGGYAVWAHPLRRRNTFTEKEESLLPFLDGMEVGNAMNEKEKRKLATTFADKYNLLKTAGSDAHVSGQVGMGVLKVKEKITKNNFLKVVKEGEIIIREEVAEYREDNIKWKKRIRKLRDILRLNGGRKRKNVFTKMIIRNYLRANSPKLKRIKFNFKKENY